MDAIPVTETKAARRRTGQLTKDERAMQRMERDAEQRLTAALQSLGKRVMANLSSVPTEALPALLLSRIDDPATWQPFRDVLVEFLKDAALAGADFGRRQVEQDVFGVRKAITASFEVNWRLANEAAGNWAYEHGAFMIAGLSKTTRDYIARETANFVDNGLPLSELRKRIMNIETGAFSAARAQTIAVTETTRAFAEGNVAAWQQSGVIQAYEWDTANDEITCPICSRLAGMRVPMGQPFGRYGRPPAHPNCRCGLLPVVEVPELARLPEFNQPDDRLSGGVRDNMTTQPSSTFAFNIADDRVRADLEETARAIDAVHGLPPGAVPNVKVVLGVVDGYEGLYTLDEVTGEVISIALSPTTQRLTLVHEYGHHLDRQWLAINGTPWLRANTEDELINAFRRALTESRQYKQLEDMYFGDTKTSRLLQYTFEGSELWARAYTQYVAIRSGNPILLQELRELRSTPFWYQWDDDDFEPIAEALDALFGNQR